jgi:pimeloyl-ACP methyl ester carboxylesterase
MMGYALVSFKRLLMMRFLVLFFLLLLTLTPAKGSEIVHFTLSDGETVDGKLSLPLGVAAIRELVVFVHGTGPATYDNHRKFGKLEFDYFGYFADEFNRRGIAFFTYNKRGVTRDNSPPLFEKVDRDKYRKVVPSVEVRDLATYIKKLRKDRRLKNAKVILLGWSEGTVLATLAAEDKKNRVTALFLNGYVNDNLSDVIKWQNGGGSSMVNLRPIFDADKNGSISRAEYESGEAIAAGFRVKGLGNAKFDQLDVNKDGTISIEDFAILTKPRLDAIFAAVERGDDDWIWNNYFQVSSGWLREHFALEANHDRMLRLKIPIYIFQGENDANTPVEGAHDIKQRFDKAGKKNLKVLIFPAHDHDLNFVDWVRNQKIPVGIAEMFATAESLNK